MNSVVDFIQNNIAVFDLITTLILVYTITQCSLKGFTLSLELAAKAHRLNYKMLEIPTVWMERDKGKSRFKLVAFILPYAKWFFYIIKTSIFNKNAK